MSIGVDVSPLYADMLQAIEIESNRDVRQTRLVYLYLSAVAPPSADLALLLVNSLHKHARHASPVLRHEALRSLAATVAATGASDYVQFVAPVLNRALDDSHPLVRRGATLAALVCARRPGGDAAVRDDLATALETLVEDRDDLVALNALLALCQLRGPAFVPAHAVLVRLQRAAPSLHEFARAYANELLLRVERCSDEQRVELLNALDPQLEHAEACVATSAAAAMLHLCRDSPLLASVCRRLVAPLVALVAHPANDAAHFLAMRNLATVLPHAADAPVDVELFFVRHSDAPFVQIEKARLLAAAANAANGAQCVELLGAALRVIEPVSVVDAVLAALVRIAVRLPARADDVRKRLLHLCGAGSAPRRSAAVVRAAELLAARPDLANEAALQAMSEHLLTLSRDAHCALLSTLADVGPLLADGAALLAELLNAVRTDDSELVVRLLEAALRCFVDGGAAYSRVAIDALQLCLASDDARVRHRAELHGAALARGKAAARAALHEPRRAAATVTLAPSATFNQLHE